MPDYLGASPEEVSKRRKLVLESLEAINDYNWPNVPRETQTILKVKSNLIVANRWNRVLRLPKEVDLRYIEASIPSWMKESAYDKPVLSLVLLDAALGSDILLKAEIGPNVITYYWRASQQPPFRVVCRLFDNVDKVYSFSVSEHNKWAISLRAKLFALDY